MKENPLFFFTFVPRLENETLIYISKSLKSLNLEYPPNNQPRHSEGQPGCFNSHCRRSITGVSFARSAAAAAGCNISGTVSSS